MMSTEEGVTSDTENETRGPAPPQAVSSRPSAAKRPSQASAAAAKDKASEQTLHPDPAHIDPLAVPKKNAYDPTALEFQSKIIKGHTNNTGLYFGKFCSGVSSSLETNLDRLTLWK